MKKVINIDCEGTSYLDIDELKNFQGNLKELHEDDYNKLKASILEEGFKFPVFIWEKNILDGHQRIFVIRKLMKEGYKLSGKIPIITIRAKNAVNAKKLLLMLNSKFGKLTYQGLYEFIGDEPEINAEELLKGVSLDDIDAERYIYEFEKDIGDKDMIPIADELITKRDKRGEGTTAGIVFRIGKFTTYIRDKRLMKEYRKIEKKLLNSNKSNIEKVLNEINYTVTKIL